MNTVDPKQAEQQAFKEKLKTLHFGIVPGAYRSRASKTYYDAESLPDFPSKEEVQDTRTDYRNTPTTEMRLGQTSGREKETGS